MNVKKLKEILYTILDELEEIDEGEEVKLYSNTYFMGYPYYFLGISGNNGGFINLDNPTNKGEEDD